jgi:hypothetical protein
MKKVLYFIAGLVVLGIIIKLLPLGIAIGLTVLMYKKNYAGKGVRLTLSALAITIGLILTIAIGSSPDEEATPAKTEAKVEAPVEKKAVATEAKAEEPAKKEVAEEPAKEEAEPVAEAPAEPAKPEMTVSQQGAVQSAESYLSMGGFSKKSLAEQLNYEGFPKADIDFAIANVSVDWKEQCKQSAENYMEMGGFSKQSLTEQLQYEGFLPDEVSYGVQSVGL